MSTADRSEQDFVRYALCMKFQINCDFGKTLTDAQLLPFENRGYTAFIVNLCETSTGVLYDLRLISDFCKRNGLLLIVDAVSAFLCDSLDMTKHKIDVVITGSQKALALAPGLSLMCFSQRAVDRILAKEQKILKGRGARTNSVHSGSWYNFTAKQSL